MASQSRMIAVALLMSAFPIIGCGQERPWGVPQQSPYVPCRDMTVILIHGGCEPSWGCSSLCEVRTDDGADRYACEPVVGEKRRVCGQDLEEI